MPRLWGLALVAGVLAAEGCSLQPGVPLRYSIQQMKTDGMTGKRMEGNYVSTPPLPYTRLAINAARAEAPNGRVLYFIEANLDTRFYITIPPGESLVFTADGERIALSGPGSEGMRKRVSGSDSWLNEVGLYLISAADLRKLAAASQVQFRLSGKDQIIDNAFNQVNLDRLRAFVEENVPPEP